MVCTGTSDARAVSVMNAPALGTLPQVVVYFFLFLFVLKSRNVLIFTVNMVEVLHRHHDEVVVCFFFFFLCSKVAMSLIFYRYYDIIEQTLLCMETRRARQRWRRMDLRARSAALWFEVQHVTRTSRTSGEMNTTLGSTCGTRGP